MKLFRLFIIPLFLILGYFILISYPYFFSKINHFDSLGISSLVEEKADHIKKIGGNRNTLLAGEKITGEVTASEDNFGVLLLKFAPVSLHATDRVLFRIKEVGGGKWYYEQQYQTDQFQPNQYFTFGFPVINNAKNKRYIFEIESLSGTEKNGIRLSSQKPNLALVYTFPKKDMLSMHVFSFIGKKFLYVFHHVSFWKYWPILIAAFLLYFMRKKQYQKILKIINKFLKRITRQWRNTKSYSIFLNSTMKKRVIVGLLLFLLAFLYRLSTASMHHLGTLSFYETLGNQGDYDQFIRTATCAIRSFCPAILGQNFLIESSLLGGLFAFFGFIGGLKAYLYLMIVLSSIVAILPYLILSRKHFFTIGGIIGSLFLATSPFLTNMALRLPPDNLSLFFFSLFFVIYLITIQRRTLRWLIFLGLMGAIDGLNKLMILANDFSALILFIPVFFFEKTKKIVTFPFVTIKRKIIFYSLLPFLVFLLIYFAWESLVQVTFGTPYYLIGLIKGNSLYASSTDAATISLKEGLSQGNLLEKCYYYLGSSVVLLKRLIEVAHLNIVLLAPLFFGLVLVTFRKKKYVITKLIGVTIFVIFAVMVLELFRNNYWGIQSVNEYGSKQVANSYLGTPEVNVYVPTWPDDIYLTIFLFTGIMFLFVMNFTYKALKLSLPILPYVAMLILLTPNAPWFRLLAHPVVWSIILLAFLFDWVLHSDKKKYVGERIVIAIFPLVLFLLVYTVPKVSTIGTRLWDNYHTYRNEVIYLHWVNKILPDNAVLLAGGGSDLITVAEQIKKPIFYNARWSGAVRIKPGEILGVPPNDFNDFAIVKELKNKENFRTKRYLILEDDVALWRKILLGTADKPFNVENIKLSSDDYLIVVYQFNTILDKSIYELKYKKNSD